MRSLLKLSSDRSRTLLLQSKQFNSSHYRSMQIILEVPDRLAEKLQQLGDRLPEALDRALQELTPLETISYQDELQIVELLASQPSPEVILAIRPTPALQTRMSELLDRNKSGTLSRSEEVELDRYLLLEHWVRLAKAHAYKHLQIAA
jgi:16S rRNA C1402 (ribose-2'-O) methylase RsmI